MPSERKWTWLGSYILRVNTPIHNRAPSAVAVAGHSSKKVGEYLAGKKTAKKAAAKKKKRAAKRKKA
jgi:hypothetical protein